ncbi:MAG: dihydrofolate reductase [Rhodobacteraceae bacterium]|nr:dihydrofolate reductase [Paracoccaceae bacterium]
MIRGHVFIACSLDGFIAREDGGLDWLELPGAADEDHGYSAFMAQMDGLLMGRRSFEAVLSFGDWPYEKPVTVLSRSLSPKDIPDDLRGKVDVHPGPLPATMQTLAGRGWRNVYLDGGQTVSAALQAGLVAEMTITRLPVLLGRGIPLFRLPAKDIALTLIEQRSFPSGMVQSRYSIAKR